MVDNITTPIPSSTVFKTKDFGANGHGTAHVLFDTAEAEVLGLVTASPAANTVLGRLKDLLSLIVLAAGTNLIGNVGHGKTIKTVSGTLTADTDVIAAVTSKRIKVIAYSVITTGVSANAAIFKSNGTTGTELWRLFLQGSGGIVGVRRQPCDRCTFVPVRNGCRRKANA